MHMVESVLIYRDMLSKRCRVPQRQPALVQERSLVALSFMDEDSDSVSLPQVPLWSTGLDIGVSMKAQQLRTSPRRREAPGSSRGQGNKRAALLNTSTLNRLTCIDYSETEKLLIVWPYDRWPYLEAFLLDTQQQTTNRCLIQTPSCWQTLAFHSMNQIKAVLVHGTTDIVVAGPMARIEILSLRLRSAASIMGQDPSKGIEMPSTAPNDASGGHILNRCVGQLVKQADLRLPTLGEIVSLAWTEDGHSLLVLVTSGSCYVLKQSAMQSVSNRLDPCTAYPTWSIERRLDRVIMEQNGDAEAIDNPWPHRDGLQTRQNERFPLQSRAPSHESPVGNSEHQLSSGWPRQIPLAVYGGRPKQVAGTDASTSTQSAYLVYTSGIASVDLHTKRCSIAAIPRFMPLPKSQGVPLSLMNREPLLASCSVSMTQSRHRVPLGTCLLAACTPTRLMLLAPQVSSVHG
ncbi:hypothetical protein F1559_002252 [Cyanidiococcus yangmingshanensis]|uniref:Uncharacterized protein n=1 Tax=Cyanidiococcus yangmingshanensis TaxID=2690220 RepID=A0A7J7IBW0_9RHOD|nr:hypothetical protein F1559_002252 [Cyanidiococcus yangmingshanensis]